MKRDRIIVTVGLLIVFLLVSWLLFSNHLSRHSLKGIYLEGLGRLYDSTIDNNLLRHYSSEDLDISFDYPSYYALFEEMREDYTISIVPKTYVESRVEQDTIDVERSPSIYLIFRRMFDPTLSLEEWILTQPMSRFDSSERRNDALEPTTVMNTHAFRYHVSGLYRSEYTVFVHNEWVVVAIANITGESDDRRNDLRDILASMSSN